MNQTQVENFIYEALETELVGVRLYERAVQCAEHPELRQEWRQYLEQTRRHVTVLKNACSELGLEANRQTPGGQVVRGLGEALIKCIDVARESGDKRKAQIVAAEAVLHAESKDHMNWRLIGLCAKEAPDRMSQVLQKAYDEIEDQEDERYYHSRGWARELAVEHLGLEAVIPPPEENMDIKSAMAAATVEKGRRFI